MVTHFLFLKMVSIKDGLHTFLAFQNGMDENGYTHFLFFKMVGMKGDYTHFLLSKMVCRRRPNNI